MPCVAQQHAPAVREEAHALVDVLWGARLGVGIGVARGEAWLALQPLQRVEAGGAEGARHEAAATVGAVHRAADQREQQRRPREGVECEEAEPRARSQVAPIDTAALQVARQHSAAAAPEEGATLQLLRRQPRLR